MKSLADDVLYLLQSLVILLMENEFAKTYRSREYPLKRMQHAVLDVMIGRAPYFYVDARGVESFEAKLFHAAHSLGISQEIFKERMARIASRLDQ